MQFGDHWRLIAVRTYEQCLYREAFSQVLSSNVCDVNFRFALRGSGNAIAEECGGYLIGQHDHGGPEPLILVALLKILHVI